MMKKAVSILLAVFLLMSNMTGWVGAQAPVALAPSVGDGSQANPYEIANISNLYWIALDSARWDKYYKQTADIDASGTATWDGGQGWTPIGNTTTRFKGSYNGQGYVIYGLRINRPDTPNVGLFGHVGDNTIATTIENLGLQDVVVIGARGTGSLIGRVTGNINTLVRNCYAINGTVVGDGATGGLTGSFNSYIENPAAGENFRPRMMQCFADIDVSFSGKSTAGKDKFGGLSGCGQKGMIINCFARGSVTANGCDRVGGLVGCVYLRGWVEKCYATGQVTGIGSTNIGGLVGFKGDGNLIGYEVNNVWDMDTTQRTASAAGTGKTTAQMKQESTFTSIGWDFNTIWYINSTVNDGYPFINGLEIAEMAASILTVTKNQENLVVNIAGWKPNYQYQIWTYQAVTSDLFLDKTENVKINQWILSSGYMQGSAGQQQTDGSVSFLIAMPSQMVNGKYLISAKIQDENGNYLGELQDTYTPEDIGMVKISNIIVDGAKAKGTQVKEIKTHATVSMTIDAVNADRYALTVNGQETFSYGLSNTFVWDIQDYDPGEYELGFYAKNTANNEHYTQSLSFTLYSKNEGINYATISDMQITHSTVNNKKLFSINPQTQNADQFYYMICEPGRNPLIKSGTLSPNSSYNQELTANGIGTFDVFGYVKRLGNQKHDDGVIKRVQNKRDEGPLSLNMTINNSSESAYTTTKNTALLLESQAVISTLSQEQILYSYYRYDANGWVLIRDWSSTSSLNWTPARSGKYTIQVRAKGSDAASYEISKFVNVDVSLEEIASNISISINEEYLNTNAEARVPISINATAVSQGQEPLLYKFYVSDALLGTTQLHNYSPDQNCIWVPRKAGTYTISVLVKNEDSFGKFDHKESFTVTVR